MSESKYQFFLQIEVPLLLKDLRIDQNRVFGRMTPQHMVEHLIWVSKSSVKNVGIPPENPSEKEISFNVFIKSGANFRHTSRSRNQEDLPNLRMSSLIAAIDEIPEAISRLYQNNTDRIFYNPLMGQLNFYEMEYFHFKHYKYHLQHQFGLGLY